MADTGAGYFDNYDFATLGHSAPRCSEYPNYPELWYQYYTADSQQSGVVLPGTSDYPYNFDSTSALSVYYDNLRAMNSNTFESPWPSPEIVQTPNTPPFIYRTHGPQSWSPPASSSDEPTPDVYDTRLLNPFEAQFERASLSGSRRHTVSISSSSSRSSSPAAKKNASAVTTPNDDDAQRRRHPCLVPGCTRRFTSQYTLKVHTEAHKPKPRASYPCTFGCREWFSRQHDRLRHEVAKHNKVCEFSCESCGRFFSTHKTLGNHRCPMAQDGTRWVHQ